MQLKALTLVAALSACSLAAHADSYQYTLDFDAHGFTSTETFIVPSIITSDTTVTDVTGSATTAGPAEKVEIFVNSACGASVTCFESYFFDGYDNLLFTSPVDSVGTYDDYLGDGTLTIAAVPTPTPEPSTFLLLGTGLLGAGSLLRRRFA